MRDRYMGGTQEKPVQDGAEELAKETEKQIEKQADEQEKPVSQGAAFEGIYDRLPDISIRALDWFIAACVVALVAVVLIGILKARHII